MIRGSKIGNRVQCIEPYSETDPWLGAVEREAVDRSWPSGRSKAAIFLIIPQLASNIPNLVRRESLMFMNHKTSLNAITTLTENSGIRIKWSSVKIISITPTLG